MGVSQAKVFAFKSAERAYRSSTELWLVLADAMNDQRTLAADALNRLLGLVHRKVARTSRRELLAETSIGR